MKKMFVFLILLNSMVSNATLKHIGSCYDKDDSNETPLRIFQNTEDHSKGLIAIEFPDPSNSNKTIVSTESITLRFNSKTNTQTIIFDENSVLKKITETSGFDMKPLSKIDWVSKHRNYECLMDDSSDRERMFNLAKKIGSIHSNGNKEIAENEPYKCEKQTIIFNPGFDEEHLDPIDIYSCFYINGK